MLCKGPFTTPSSAEQRRCILDFSFLTALCRGRIERWNTLKVLEKKCRCRQNDWQPYYLVIDFPYESLCKLDQAFWSRLSSDMTKLSTNSFPKCS